MTVLSTMNRRQMLEQFVSGRIVRIQRAYLEGRSEGNAWLAELRKSGDTPGASPATWTIEFEGFPDELVGKTDEPSPGERAAHLAFCLYATHQQSQGRPMHQSGRDHDLGAAVARLQTARSNAAPTDQLPSRFAALGTAGSMDEITHYMRQLVTLLRAQEIPLDYGRLAGQIYRLQNPATADAVRLEWGRGFAGTIINQLSDKEED